MQVGRLLAENEVTRLERPDLVESAVAVEFSSRMQTVWQVRVLAGDAGSAATCGPPDASVPGRAARTASCTGEPSIGTFDVAPPGGAATGGATSGGGAAAAFWFIRTVAAAEDQSVQLPCAP